eukprot:TRINITY_DN323_c1_g1_i2.p2 TRINITY_DN323_c1_g1~~TRINITY_DN323_c1_g1_i2.p2  ORF type:complete len:100 (+),score=1.63 TRINITY_DN323_c1_g1_i2:55-354(+)
MLTGWFGRQAAHHTKQQQQQEVTNTTRSTAQQQELNLGYCFRTPDLLQTSSYSPSGHTALWCHPRFVAAMVFKSDACPWLFRLRDYGLQFRQHAHGFFG